MTFGKAIRDAHRYLLENYPEVFVIGQGLWSPWYVGSSMTDLDKDFGTERVIDTPVSEDCCTGVAIGAALSGYKTLVIHPRMDFMILATNQIVNQAAKWSHMLGGQDSPSVTVRGIINRGGQQGAQHSQALHGWYANIPGLKVVMPATPNDARELLISSVLSGTPVMFVEDRWLYDWEDEMLPIKEVDLSKQGPNVLKQGEHITLVGSGYTTYQNTKAAKILGGKGVSAEVVDLRVINPLDITEVLNSVEKTGRLLAVDSGWANCGLAGEIIAAVSEKLPATKWKETPKRLTTVNSPAPTSGSLEDEFYFNEQDIVNKALEIVRNNQ